MEVGMQGAWGRGRWIAICALVAPFALGANAQSAGAAEPPLLTEVTAVAVGQNAATLKARIDPRGKATTYSFEYGLEDCETSTCTQAGGGSVSVLSTKEAPLEGLSPGTLYHYRVTAQNADGKASSGDRVFFTRSAVFSGLPDGRAYEQASPIDKDGGDVQGYVPLIKATEDGNGITFESTFGVPGGKGAQEFPTYLASRDTGGWSTEGLLPPFVAGDPSEVVGQRAQVIGWSPDFTEIFSSVTRLGEPRAAGLVVQSGSADPVTIAPYTPGGPVGAGAEYSYAGQSTDGSVVLFESTSKLTEEARAGFPNVYAWDHETGNLTVAGTYNDGTSPPRGTLAGAYWWVAGTSGRYLSLGGAERSMYLRDEHAISPDGAVVFTEASTGQLYRRINPTAEQSATKTNGKGEEECEDAAKACTIHMSASHRTPPDPAGPQPAAFQAAGADGSEVFFTSPEKLTNDANTGPEQSPAQIERDDLAGGSIEKPDFITPQAALGVAVDGSHVYWVDPSGTIGRSDLNGTPAGRQPEFIDPGTIECEVQGEPGVFKDVPSIPRYLAVDAEHIYWTNTGCSDEFGPLEGTGTIGRADIDGEAASIEPAFITGASNPQGVAVNSEHIYWANAGREAGVRAIGWATIEGDEVSQSLIKVPSSLTPYGVALSGSHVYYSANNEGQDFAYIRRSPLEEDEQEVLFIGKEGIRGLALDSEHVYWASQGEEAIGRADLELTPASKDNEFIKLEGKPTGLALSGTHLYWSTNGESPTNPGNDLYRYGPKPGELEDMTVDPTGNGAEVQGVLGTSPDGKYVYFAANGILDDAEEAEQGDCKGPVKSARGNCSLYLWHDGSISLIARLRAGGSERSDALNWTSTPRELFGSTSYFPKTSFLSADGQTLLFRSQEQLTDYANEGVLEFYRFRVGDPEGIRCVSCNPAGEAAGEGPGTGRLQFPALGPWSSVMAVSARFFSADGDHAFFEATEALVPEDTNSQGGCPPPAGSYRACIDTYEWEAAGAGGCQESSPAYSPLNDGCIYLLSTGKSKYPSLFADASASGDDVFFFTRDRLVGQDKDEIQDVYDARVGVGLASQNPPFTVPCEAAESCHEGVPPPPSEPSPATPNFHGPPNPKPVHKKPKPKPKPKKHKAKKKQQKKKHHKKQKRTGAERRNAR